MSQTNLTENLSEIVTKTFKKTEIFEKIVKLEFYVGSFVLFSSIIGVTCIYMSFLNSKELTDTKKCIEGSERVLKYNIETNLKQIMTHHFRTNSDFLALNDQLSELIENQKTMIYLLEEIKLIKKAEEYMNRIRTSNNTSVSSFSPIKNANTIFDVKTDIDEDIRDEEYDELLNECYDIIPLNNVKKNTGLSWLY